MTPEADTQLRRELRDLLTRRRHRTLGLIDPLDEHDVHAQFFPIMGPLVWDVGHIGNFEELWLLRELDGRPPHDEALDTLYNPFENPRWVRGDLPILDRDAAVPYLAEVRDEALALLDRTAMDADRPLTRGGYVYRMIAQHEAQHQETMLQALGLRTDLAPYAPAAPQVVATPDVDDTERITIPGGPHLVGTTDRTWAYDNERPQHTRDTPTFAIDRFPVTNRRYAAFIRDGGYRRDELWSDAGRSWRDEHGHTAPQGWLSDGAGGWDVRRFGHLLPLHPSEPVQHVSFWEAEAFASWTGARLPTEFEWEKAAAHDPVTGSSRVYPWGDAPVTAARANIEAGRFGPRPVGSNPQGASAYGVEGLLGDVYQWTSSPFEGYPDFTAWPYPEYSEVFFGEGYRVLRGASWAIATVVARNTYRNWDNPDRRQIFAGIRLAWDVAPGDA